MRLTCPQCSTEYDVPDTALVAGSRRLRCDRCGHEWRQAAPGAVPDRGAPEPLPVAVEPVPEDLPVAIPENVTTENLPKFLSKRDPRGYQDADGLDDRAKTVRSRLLQAEPPRRRPARTQRGRTGRIMLLVVLVVIAVLFAHRDIEHSLPASVGFFQALGLK
jgi:predicted Zn finger-like uncharacterized protein